MIGFYDYTVIATYLASVLGLIGTYQAMDGHIMVSIFCLLVSGLLDTVDGRIARTKKSRTDSEKRFGIQIDSLNDMVCFGVLPTVIACRLWEGTVPVWFTATLCFFALCGLIRLAYFNVTEEERQSAESGGRKYYLGLPITSSTLILPLLYLLTCLLPAAKAVILTLGLLITGLLYILPIHIAKPGLRTVIILLLIGASELAGLIYIAAVQIAAMPL